MMRIAGKVGRLSSSLLQLSLLRISSMADQFCNATTIHEKGTDF